MIKENKNKTTNITLGNNYEINKQLVEKNLNELSQEQINEKKEKIANFIKEKNNKYYMLLCNERKDYTVFTLTNKQEKNIETSKVLVDECLMNRGKIKAIDKTKDNQAIEIWLSMNKESFCYYFFPYDEAIVEV